MGDRKEQPSVDSKISPSKEYTLKLFYELC